MRIVRPDHLVVTSGNAYGSKICYKPHTRYVVSDFEHLYLMDHTPNTRWAWSSFNSYERRYGGQDLNGKRLLLYRHTAWGDQLMVSAIPRYLKSLYPNAIIHFYCDPHVSSLWDENEYVEGGAIALPIHFDSIQHYNYHLLYEGMLENNGERDQRCCYDDFFAWAGLDPEEIPPHFKRPYVKVLARDYQWIIENKVDIRGKYMVYHLSPANMNRCYPIDFGMKFIRDFLKKHKDWRVFLVGSYDNWTKKKDHGIVDLVNETPDFRSLIPVIENAKLVVCPDSSIMHLAASFDHVHVISLWGLFDPNDRAAYYPNHHAMCGFAACPHAPCRNHEFRLPLKRCKDAVNFQQGQQYCCALAAIGPEHIIGKVETLMEERKIPS